MSERQRLEELEAAGRKQREEAEAENRSTWRVGSLDGFDAAVYMTYEFSQDGSTSLEYDTTLMAEILARGRFADNPDPWAAAVKEVKRIVKATPKSPGSPSFRAVSDCDECSRSSRLCDCYPELPASEELGVTLASYRPERRFRVIRDGARFIHGDFGTGGGRVPIPKGSIIEVDGLRNCFDIDQHLIWSKLDGRRIKGIHGNDPHPEPWAEFEPHCLAANGPDRVSVPDPSYLEPVDADGNVEPW